MAKNDAATVDSLEKVVDGLLGEVDGVLKGMAAPGAPHSEDEDQTGSGKDNTADYRRRVSRHTQQVGKAKSKSKSDEDDDEDDDMEKSENDDVDVIKAKGKKKPADDEDDDEDDWSQGSDSTTKRRITKSAEDSEYIELDGERIHKADVPEGLYKVLKKQADRITKTESDLKKAQDDANMERLRKRADDVFKYVPGTVDERANMLKAIDIMPADLKKTFETVLTAHNRIAKSAFDTLGHKGGDPDLNKSAQVFTAKVTEIQKRDSISRTEAMSKARREDPEGFKAYQEAGAPN